MTRGTEIIAAIAQQPFWTGDNQFATVKPLAMVEQDRLTPVRDGEFPNRNLCWWLIRNMPSRELLPGRLIVGYVEDAERFDPLDANKDRYQIAWDTVKLGGARNIIEIIDAPRHLEPRAIVNTGSNIRLDHPPTTLVLVRLGDRIYGPFRAEHEPWGSEYRINLTKPQSNREDTAVFEARSLISDRGHFTIANVALSNDGRPLNQSSEVIRCNYRFITWSRFEALQEEAAERIILLSDDDVLRRAAKLVLSSKQLRDFMKEWKDLSEVYLGPASQTEPIEVKEVFKALSNRLTQQCDAVDELVNGLLKAELLQERIEAAIAAEAETHIQKNAAKLGAEVEARISDLRARLEELKEQERNLDNLIERRRRSEEERLHEDLAARRREFEQQMAAAQEALAHERNEIEVQRRNLEASLQGAARRFETSRDSLLTDFLALSPFLRQIGVFGGVVGAHGHQGVEAAPAVVTKPRGTPPPTVIISDAAGADGLTDEQAFFERFQQHVERAGFRFKPLDLVSFHLSVKCGDLTILGGLSGTGKSSLPLLYAQALAGDERRFLAVDVSPAWLEPGDLLGRLNLLEGQFQPAPTRLFEHLVGAALEVEHSGKDSGIWLVCLDEMNLAQPEHYLSGLLQALPRAGDQRAISVFSPAAVAADDPWQRWHRVPLHQNLRLVGTVNFDETTRPLSQRLLDRANQIQLEAVPFGSLQQQATTATPPPTGAPVTIASFERWIRDANLTGKAAETIDELQPFLAALGSPLTPRRYQAIARFVASSPGLCTCDEAFDMQLRQRVLSQVRGLFRSEARRALDGIRDVLDRHGSSYAGALAMLESIRRENVHEIDFDAFNDDN